MAFRNVSLALVSLFVLFSMFSCANPKKAEIPQDIQSWKSNQKFKKSVEKLSPDDKKLFLSYVMKTQMSSVFGGEGLKKGTTIEDALKIEKEWQAEQEKEELKRQALAAELQKKQLEAMKKMNEAVTTSLVNFGFRKSDWQSGTYSDYFTIKVGFKNNTDRDISGVRGVVVLKDIFSETIKRINLSNDNGIKANSTSTYSGTMDFNQFKDEDTKLRGTEFSKLKYEWEPDVYLFDDGSKMEMPKE